MGKAEHAPITIELRHRNRIVTIHTDEYDAYQVDLEPGSYFVVRALNSDGKEIEFLLDQLRCIKGEKENDNFCFMLRPPSAPAQQEHQDFSKCDCESAGYGFLQGNIEYMEVGNCRRAPGITAKLRHDKKTVVIHTDNFGEYLEKLEPGKYCIIEVLGSDNEKLELFPGQPRCIKVKSKDCLRFYIELVPPPKAQGVAETPSKP